MQKKTKIITLILTLITAFSVLALSISADYTRVPNDSPIYGLKYAIGTTSNQFIVTGKSNTEVFSDSFGGGGENDGVYTPYDVQQHTYPYYTLSREQANVTPVLIEDSEYKYGTTNTIYYVQATENIQAIQHKANVELEGQYGDLFTVTEDSNYVINYYFLPAFTYRVLPFNGDNPFVDATTYVNATVVFVTEHNQRIEGKYTSSQNLRNNSVTITPLMMEAITKAHNSAIETALRLETAHENQPNKPNPSQRAKLTLTISTTARIYGRPTNEGFMLNDDLQVRVQYPLCNNRLGFPTTYDVPFVNVSNKIESDFSLTEWFGASARGIWKFELIPNVTIGGIVTAVLGISVTLAFLKFFAGG